MKVVAIILSFILSAVPIARTIVVDSDPSGADVWSGGAHLGEAPILISETITEPLTLTLKKSGYKNSTHVIEIPEDGEDHIYVLSLTKSGKKIGLSILLGIGSLFVVFGLMFGIAALSY